MKKCIALGLLLACVAVQHAIASGIVRIADGDCAGLSSAVAAQPGQEPSLIVLASHGTYQCRISLGAGEKISIDGAGASFYTLPGVLGSSTISVSAGASLTLHNLNLAPPASASAVSNKAKGPPPKPAFPIIFGPPISNGGNLTLDSVSMRSSSVIPSSGCCIGFGAAIENGGTLTLRNVSMTDNTGPMIGNNGGTVEIFQSTFTANRPLPDSTSPVLHNTSGTIRIANSIVAGNGTSTNCGGDDAFTSLGGNVVSDQSCGFNAANDRLVADAGVGSFGTHGGVVNSLALNYNSPAIGNGLAANCEAIDARGAARGQNSCDSGAYEFGGGQGHIGVSGTSGLYFNHDNNGHYVSVQRVFDDNALVIWNTFDERGKPAWLYGVGAVNGGSIHVAQVAQNLGGVLQPGGAVSGVTPTFWGSFDLDVSNCYSATLHYNSALPQFGSGTVNLDRLAFVNGLDCSP